jgi:PAS domain S-box-containing protein
MNTLPYTLLIVDDFAADRELYRRSLLADSRSTYRPIEAESVAEGLKLCQSHAIDGVLLDYMLPDGDGLKFLEALSELYRGDPPPVVMLTGQGNETLAVQAMKLGVQDYLVKHDLTPALLQLTMRTAIDNARLKRQLAQYQERFRVSIDNMRECVSIFSAIRDDAGQIIDFRFDYLNPAALENNRMTAKDLGRKLCEVFPVFSGSGLFEEYCQVVETGEPLIKEELIYEDIFAGEKLRRNYSIHVTKLDDGFVSCWRDETAKRAVEQGLQVANQKIVDIWESMTDAYVTVDRDWRVIYANRAATQIVAQVVNLETAEFLGKSHWELFPSLIGTEIEREYRHALAEGVAVHREIWFEPAQSWFEVHLYPSGEGLGIYFRDITDRRQIETERITAIEERDRFFNLSLDLLAVGNFDGYLARINPAFERLLGFTQAEFMQRPFIEFVHPDDRESTVAGAQSLAQGEMVVNYENRCLCKDGSYRWISWNATPYVQSGVWYGVGRNITDRKRLELERLEATEERDRFFNLSIDLLAIGSFDGEYFLRLNPAWELTLGFTTAELMAESFINFVHPDDRELTLAAAQNLADGMPMISCENRYRCKDGSYRWISWNAIPHAPGRVWYAIGHDITDRKRLELARIAAEQERDRFFNLSIDLLVTLNFDGYFTRVNPAWERALGFSTAELMARPFVEFVHPDDRASTLAAAQEVITGGVLMSFENRYLCKDGSYRWLLWSAIPYPDQNVMYGIAHDITDRKQQEAALRESERKFSAIFEQSFELMGIASLDGVLLEVNQTALDSIAARREDIAGKLFWETPWWHTEQLQQQLQDAIERAGKGEFVRYEVTFPHPSGAMLTTDFSLKPVFDETNSVVTIVAEARDITDRQRAERDLRESQERLQAGIAVAGVGLARFDYATNLVSLSPEAAALYGFAPDVSVVTREQIHETFHPDERAKLEAIIAQVLDPAGEGWFADDHQVVWPNGEVRCLSVRKKVYFDRSGAVHRPSHAILAAIDITDRQQTQSALEERNRELDRFVYVVSHDLKAPLRAVANLSQWIEEDLQGSLSVANQQQMQLLRNRVYRMEATIDGLLEYARIGSVEAASEPVSVAQLVRESIDSIAPPPIFKIAIAQNLPTIYTSRLLLSQVFANTIGNGIKHHDRADGSLHIGIAERGEFYEFAIADDGPGIPPEYHERIFTIFQAVNPQKRTDSTGIGLAIVKKIVEAQGGAIWLESQVGKGTTFYFTWPKRR